ncbi:MAG: hypothetical protein ACOCUS_02590, partial [Polyangiales bacterium]
MTDRDTETPATVRLPLSELADRTRTRGAVETASVAGDGRTLSVEVRLVGGEPTAGGGGFGEVLFDVSDRAPLQRAWGERAHITVDVRPSRSLTGDFERSPRARIVLVDGEGRRMYLTHQRIADDGWSTLAGRPTTAVPMPLGFT